MDQLYGLIDSIEANILEGKKVPFSDRVILDEKKMLSLIDKIRMVLKSNGDIVKQSIDINSETPTQAPTETVQRSPSIQQQVLSDSLIKDAETEAKDIKKGADEYADYVLANLQLTVTKMQSSLLKMEKNITGGRKVLEDKHPNKKEEK